MAEIKCPCGLRNNMEEEDCKNTNCNACCSLTRPQTNADRIRAMSDEELAMFLAEVEFRRSSSGGGAKWGSLTNTFAWLKQPA